MPIYWIFITAFVPTQQHIKVRHNPCLWPVEPLHSAHPGLAGLHGFCASHNTKLAIVNVVLLAHIYAAIFVRKCNRLWQPVMHDHAVCLLSYMMKGILLRQKRQLKVYYLDVWPDSLGKIKQHCAVFAATPKHSRALCSFKGQLYYLLSSH